MSPGYSKLGCYGKWHKELLWFSLLEANWYHWEVFYVGRCEVPWFRLGWGREGDVNRLYLDQLWITTVLLKWLLISITNSEEYFAPCVCVSSVGSWEELQGGGVWRNVTCRGTSCGCGAGPVTQPVSQWGSNLVLALWLNMNCLI